MRSNFRIVSILVLALSAVAFALAVTSCDKSPTRPTPIPTPTPSGNVPAPTVSRITVSGPASVEPGGAAQLSAIATKTDGSTEDVTSQSTWSSTNAGVLDVNAGGVMTGRARGQAAIIARYQLRSGSLSAMVLPNGTFRLVGTVTDSGIPLPGAIVQVIGGIGEGLTTTTDGGGGYVFYGVAGNVRLHAKKEGYQNQIEEIQVTANRSANIAMTFAGQRLSLAGNYTLTIAARAQCTAIPQAARNRTYIATIEQNGVHLSVTLSGADFIVTNGVGNRFDGDVLGDRVTFRFGDTYYYYYYVGASALVERFPPTALVISGTVTASATASRISGRMAAVIGIARNAFPPFSLLTSSCSGSDHQFEMVR